MFNKVLIEVGDRTQQLLQSAAKAEVYGLTPERVAEYLVREGLRRLYGDAALVGPPPGRT